MLNRVCARPEVLILVLSAAVTYAFFGTELQPFVPHDWQWMLYLWALAAPAASLLMFFFCYVIFGRPISFICCKNNGGPHRPGDQVVVLTGAHGGGVATVCGVTLGQGGSELPVVDLGLERQQVFEEWSLLAITRGKQECKVNWGELTRNLGIKPRVLHRVCAHLVAVMFATMLATGALSALLIDWLQVRLPLQYLAPELFLGAVLLAIASGMLVGLFCCRMNGWPIRPGDQVLVLSGLHEGSIAEVSDTVAQQGWNVAVLDFGAEGRDWVNMRSLVRIRKSERAGK